MLALLLLCAVAVDVAVMILTYTTCVTQCCRTQHHVVFLGKSQRPHTGPALFIVLRIATVTKKRLLTLTAVFVPTQA